MASPREPGTDAVADRVFVGRRRELAELRGGFDDAVAGRGRFFLVVGEPGIGKTRLVDELAREAIERGGLALWGRCWEGGGAPAYWPWMQVLRAYLRGTHGERPTVVGPGAPYLAHFVPELGDESPGRAASSIALESEHARFYLFDAAATFLKQAAERTALVVVIDDLQWADAASLLFLQFLTRDLVDARILLLGTYREIDVREIPVVADALGALGREARHVPLRGFDEDEVRLFMESTTGGSAPPAVVHAVHRDTEGNPFFVDEVVRLLVAERAIERMTDAAPAKFPVPQGVREAIRRRVAPLPPRCREALTSAAVIGRDFDVGVLQRACGVDAETMLATLAPALAREIVVRDAHGVGRYRFAHALIRETLYDEIAPAARARLHARIGEVIEDLHAGDLMPQLPALAHHFREAAAAGGGDKAVAYAARAGRQAAASFGYEAAATYFADALDALERARPADERERCELLLARGDAQWKSADGRGARETFRRAADIARTLADAALLARSALGFAGEGSRFLWTRSGVVDQPRVDLLEEALRALGDGDRSLRARALARLAINLYWEPEPERALALSDAAVHLARELGDWRDLAAVLRARWIALWRPETAEERLAIADEIVSLGEERHDRELVLVGRRYRIVAHLEYGDVAAADREIDAWEAIARELRQPLHLADVAMWRATRAIMDGRFTDGETYAQRAREFGEREPELEGAMRYAVQTSVLHFHRGDLEQVVGAELPGLDRSTTTMLMRSHHVFLATQTGRGADAALELGALRQDGFRLPRDGGWLTYVSLLSAAAAELDDRASAALLYELLRPYATRVAIVGAGLACWGSVSLYLGLLASTLGRIDDATSHFAAAEAAHERMGARPFLAWTWLAQARLVSRRGADDQCAGEQGTTCDANGQNASRGALLARTREMARDLEMARLAAKIDELGRDATPTSEPEMAEAVFRREGDVWAVAYRGTAVRIRHMKGFGDIAILLANPGREIHVADLIAASGTASEARDTEVQSAVLSRGSDDTVLDRRARDDYRIRLGELHRELDDAERCNDEGRVRRARAELDFIAGELASALGLGGRSRRTGNPLERARKAVASRIRFSVTRLARVHPALADHLRRYVRTGTVCTYVVPAEPLDWRV